MESIVGTYQETDMAREKKDGKHISYYIDRTIYERLKQYAKDKGQTMTTAVERIIGEYLDAQDKKNQLNE